MKLIQYFKHIISIKKLSKKQDIKHQIINAGKIKEKIVPQLPQLDNI